MLKIRLSQFFAIIGKCFYFLSKKIYQPPQKIRTKKWFNIDGDRTLRLDYDLDENSITFDVGGYAGQWTSDIFSKYLCTIHVFEPIQKFSNGIQKRFLLNKKIKINNFGLSGKTRFSKISLDDDGSSIFKKGNNADEIRLVKALDYIRKNNIGRINLMKINIEGGEYELLEHLIDEKYVTNIKNIQVQFHDIIPDAKTRMKKIQENLKKTHHLTFQYEFVWENWELNG